jgi:hypothetical protein
METFFASSNEYKNQTFLINCFFGPEQPIDRQENKTLKKQPLISS